MILCQSLDYPPHRTNSGFGVKQCPLVRVQFGKISLKRPLASTRLHLAQLTDIRIWSLIAI